MSIHVGSERRPTSVDVAKRAGVSRATVSFVLNDVQGQTISPETVDRVRRAAADLGYVPFGAARALRRGHSDAALFVSPDWLPTEPVEAFRRELSAILDKHGLTSLFATASGSPSSLARIYQASSPDIVVLFSTFPDEEISTLRASGVPVVSALIHSAGGVDASTSLQFDLGAAMVSHLASRGASHLAFVGPTDPRERLFAEDRLYGAQHAARALFGKEMPSVSIDLERGAAVSALGDLRSRMSVDGLCCHNDFFALAMSDAARQLGVAVPAELRLIGVDDTIPARFTTPSLSSVRIDLASEATLVARRVLYALDPNRADTGYEVPAARPGFTVVQRESS